jgi:hypothetical protein
VGVDRTGHSVGAANSLTRFTGIVPMSIGGNISLFGVAGLPTRSPDGWLQKFIVWDKRLPDLTLQAKTVLGAPL